MQGEGEGGGEGQGEGGGQVEVGMVTSRRRGCWWSGRS